MLVRIAKTLGLLATGAASGLGFVAFRLAQAVDHQTKEIERDLAEINAIIDEHKCTSLNDLSKTKKVDVVVYSVVHPCSTALFKDLFQCVQQDGCKLSSGEGAEMFFSRQKDGRLCVDVKDLDVQGSSRRPGELRVGHRMLQGKDAWMAVWLSKVPHETQAKSNFACGFQSK